MMYFCKLQLWIKQLNSQSMIWDHTVNISAKVYKGQTPVSSYVQHLAIITCLIRVAEDGFFLPTTRSVSHPHWDGEGFLQACAHHTIRNLHSLSAIELKHLVAVMAVVSGKAWGPVGGTAGRRQQLHSVGTGTCLQPENTDYPQRTTYIWMPRIMSCCLIPRLDKFSLEKKRANFRSFKKIY